MLPLPTALRRSFLALSVALLAGAATRPTLAALPPFELNMERVKVTTFGGSLAIPSKTYFVPTVTIMISAQGSVWSQKKNGIVNSQAHAKFYVKGLDKEVVQGLAKQVQDDLVAKMRAAGLTVLTYDDLQAHPTLVGHARDHADGKWGLPITSKDPNKYVVVHPSDAQTFDRAINGPVWWMRDIAKEKDLIILVPEITLDVPLVWGEGEVGYKSAEAGIKIAPAMKFMGALVWAINGKGGTASIQVLEHGKRLVAEVAGTTKKMSEDSTDFTSTWGRTSGDFLFTLDQPVFTEGVLRVGSQINGLIVSQIQKAKK